MHRLITAIDAYLAANNTNPTPFEWTQTAEQIRGTVRRGRVALNAIPQSPTKTETALAARRGGAVGLAVDDSLFGGTGKHVYGAAWQ